MESNGSAIKKASTGSQRKKGRKGAEGLFGPYFKKKRSNPCS
jgi:hypothetical protein